MAALGDGWSRSGSGARMTRVCGCNLGSVAQWIWQLRAWAQQTEVVAQRDRRQGGRII